MVFTIDGVDILPYIAYKGLKWTRSDIDGPDAGRTMDGLMHRQRVATKIRLDITCRPLTDGEASTLLKAILPVYVEVSYTDPMEGTTVTRTMYSNNNPASFLLLKGTVGLWDGISFPLVEQ